LPRRFLALDEDCIADSIAKERADIGRGREKRLQKCGSGLSAATVGTLRSLPLSKYILQENRMARHDLRREQTKCDDDWKINVVAYRDELRLEVLIQLRQCVFIAWIDFRDARVFINDLRLVIPHSIDLVGHLVEAGLPNDHAHQFFTAD